MVLINANLNDLAAHIQKLYTMGRPDLRGLTNSNTEQYIFKLILEFFGWSVVKNVTEHSFLIRRDSDELVLNLQYNSRPIFNIYHNLDVDYYVFMNNKYIVFYDKSSFETQPFDYKIDLSKDKYLYKQIIQYADLAI